ncbi:hypothetical protein F4821DRAFT_261659 [Hypoxylon rubiginosum]|uniref:Uncharacterized protein n=1 Tax=Hypoxylon rubiginosum TaxID=110542 RepID=A0ACC0CWQ4_9PEZI|nr:hypothetical protein F4821DRAFT_261659 [Hypoxylon rubiginosum]
MDLCHLHLALVSIGAAVKGADASQVARLSASADCQSLDTPNQHSQSYPDLITGNLNGTTLIVPISLEIAQEVIPDEYEIAEQAYRELLPSFPDGMYPMVAQIVHDHDIRVYSLNTSLADFSRASLEFPFIYIAGDDHSPFRWVGTSLITYSNDIAIEGAQSYGITVHPATFDPPCDAYVSKPNGTTYAHSQSNDTAAGRFLTLQTESSGENVPYPLDFIKNVTNQPVFANPQMCDYYVRLFNTSVTKGETAPVPVVGNVRTNLEPFTGPQMWDGVYGWRLATPFLEPLEPSVCVET